MKQTGNTRTAVPARRSARSIRRPITLAAALVLAACGGGGGGGGTPVVNDPDPPNNPPPTGWAPGEFLPAAQFENLCAVPRMGDDPATGQPFADLQGETLDENNWLRSWSDELYLWYDEIVDRDPSLYADPLAYFNLLRTTATTPSGALKDRFHFAVDTEVWRNLSQSGTSAGYGATFAFLSETPPREVVVAYTEPDSPAAFEGVGRGARVLSIDGTDIVNSTDQASIDMMYAALFPSSVDELHTFEIRDLGAQATRSVTLVSEDVTSAPVQNVGTVTSPSGALVGYMLFNDHFATAEQALVDAVEQLDAANIEDLVIDIRYNGGGFLYIASELAYMVAGDVPTAGRIFEQLEFNDKHPTTNPVTGAALEPTPFYKAYRDDESSEILPLPTLDLPRVYVLTGPGTCSASESVINSLRGIGVEVIQIGSATCGKPYGFYPADNCGTTYFSIQFRGVNDAGFGDYADGFSPSGSSMSTDTSLPGCAVGDDYDHGLGDAAEARLAAALSFRDTGTCPAPAGSSDSRVSQLNAVSAAGITGDGVMYKSPWRMNRILRQ